MKIKIKKLHPDAVIPSYSKAGDAGMDLTATTTPESFDDMTPYGTAKYGTGIAVEIPKGYVGLVFPRSSIYKTTTRLSNSVGVIDSGYRGEITVQMDVAPPAIMLDNIDDDSDYQAKPYQKGDRIAQLLILPYPEIEFEEVDELSETERGEGGFGSTGK